MHDVGIATERRENFIGGEWQPPTSGHHHIVEDPFRQTDIGLAPMSDADDVAEAVRAARAAAPAWAALSPGERAGHLERILAGLEERLDELARCWSCEVGMPISLARPATGGLPVAALRSAAEHARTMPMEERLGNSRILRGPVGVVGIITPWNYPLSQIVTKTAAALAAGCTVVAKPSEIAPLCAFGFADVVAEAGLPDGVFNLVGGDGPMTGAALASDPRLGAISFTGSTRTGSDVMRRAAANITRVCLELGGKSAAVVLDRDMLEPAARATTASFLRNSGQTCTSLTRLVVLRSFADEAVDAVVEEVRHHRLGDPLDPDTMVGPLVSEQQRDRVRAYIEDGVASGARLVIGGSDAPDGITTGYFVEPTVFTEVPTTASIAREEIFGPVLSVIVVDDEEAAVAVANELDYGLAAAVWAVDGERAEAVGSRLEAGTISVNGGAFNAEAPYGGLKRSGIGYELGRFGIEEFLTMRVLNRP